MTSLENTPI